MPTDIKNLPLFVSNQVLTAELLNNMSQHLDQQTRLATLRGIGRGIVCGLEMKQDSNKITISAGYGFTSDGYLIQYEGGTFEYYKNYQDPVDKMLSQVEKIWDFDLKSYQYSHWKARDLFELTAETKETALTADFLKNKCVVLYLEFSFQDLHSCVTSNCNNKGWEMVLKVKPLLVSKEHLTTSAVLPSRPRNFFKAMPRLHKQVVLSTVHSATALMQGYETLVKSIAPKLDLWIAITYHDLKSKFDLGDLAPPQINPKFTSILNAAMGTWQTFYDFLKDIVDAYNELLQIACPFLNSVCLVEKSFGRHLTLGATSNEPNYRHLFESATVLTANQAVIERVQRYFKRLTALIQYFEPNPAVTDPVIRISPSQTTVAALGDRAVPFYYSKTEVENHWQVNHPCIYPDLTGYHFQDFAATTEIDHDFDYNYDKNNFFRIEGHLGQPIAQVENELSMWKTIHNLEFDVFSVRLSNPTTAILNPVKDENWIRGVLAEINQQLISQHFRQYDVFLLDYHGVYIHFTVYEQAISKIRAFAELKLLSPFQGWQKDRCNFPVSGSISFLQSDYLILRGELLTHFKRFKSNFKPLMAAYLASFEPNANVEAQLGLTKREVGTLTQIHLFDLYLDFLADKLLPRNLVSFHYPLFIEIFKEWHQVVYELRAFVGGVWANDLLEGLMSTIKNEGQLLNNNFSFAPLPYDFKWRLSRYLDRQTNDFRYQSVNVGTAFTVLATHTDQIIANLSDIFAFINTYFEHKTQQQLAAVYYGLEHAINHKSLIFNDFYQEHTGLEHLSGVEKGGTFVLVTDDSNQVIADFALGSKVVAKDCIFKPESIHLPPVAGTDVVYIVTSVFRRTNEGFYILQAEASINVLKNDYSMNSPLSACENTENSVWTVFLRQNESERKGKLSLDSIENGVIHYKIEMTIMDGIVNDKPLNPIDMVTYDLFDYELQETNALGEMKSDRGKVIIVIIPQPVFDTNTATKGVAIRGRVTDSFSQKGITKVAVTVREDTTNGTWTDGEGYYKLPKRIEWMGVATLEFRSDRHYGKDYSIALPASMDNFDVSVTLDWIINIRGQVAAVTGMVGKNVLVWIANVDIPPVKTDEKGFYEIQLPSAQRPNKVMIVAMHPEFGNAILKEPINLKDTNADLANIHLQLKQGLIEWNPSWGLEIQNTHLNKNIFKIINK